MASHLQRCLPHLRCSVTLVRWCVLWLCFWWGSALAVSREPRSAAATTTVVANCSELPAAALTAARDTVRAMQPLTSDVTVAISGVCSEPLVLDPLRDSATIGFRITYQGLPYEATADPAQTASGISGGVRVPWADFTEDPNAAGVYKVNLSSYGVTASTLGSLSNGGLGSCGQTLMQVFLDDIPMILARTPNAHGSAPPQLLQVPWTSWLHPSALVPNNSLAFYTNGTAAPGGEDLLAGIAAAFSSEANEYATANANVWAHGYWSWDWADNYVRISNVSVVDDDDGAAGAGRRYQIDINPSTPPLYGITCGNDAGRHYLVNHPVFLDAPGEYYVDPVTLVLSIVPPYNASMLVGRAFTLSVQADPLISLANVTETSPPLRGVTFANLSLQYGRTNAVLFTDAVVDVAFDNCSMLGFSQSGITIENGANVSIVQSFGSQLGCTAVSLSGGDTTTLSPSYNTVANNTFYGFARITRSYSRAIYVGGVGVTVEANTIFNAPHQAISASGNNHRFLSNVIRDVCYGTIDAGAFYIGRSWVNRGMELRHNHFENIFILEPVTHTGTMVSAVYWDDQQSGCLAHDNTIRNVDNCFLVGGGRDNVVTNNRCENSTNYMIFIDNRGMNWEASMCTPPTGLLVEQLYSVNYTNPPFSTAYPAIVTTLTDRPCVPVGNWFANNRYSACRHGFMTVSVATLESWNSNATNNTAM